LRIGEQVDIQALGIENPVVLLSVNPIVYQTLVMDAIVYFSKRFGRGLYVTLNKPSTVLQSVYERAGLAQNSLVFLDSITNTTEHSTETCHFLGRMRELTDLGIALARVMSEKEVKFVFVDSVSTLLIYNDSNSVARFCHAVTEKVRSLNLPAVMVLVEMEEGKGIAAQLAQFCDAYVEAVK